MVATNTLTRTDQVAPVPVRRKRRLSAKFSKYALGSLLATLVSQLVLTGAYGWGEANATVATVLAFVAGAVPNFLLNWFWAWDRRDRPALIREIAPYLVVTIGSGFAATALTTSLDHLIAPLVEGRGWQTIVLDIVYLASYGVMFMIKFALLDRVLASKTSSTVETTDTTKTPESMSTSSPWHN